MIEYEVSDMSMIDLDGEIDEGDLLFTADLIRILSKIGRFNSKVNYDTHQIYSVAEHSLWMSLQTEDPLLKVYCLLHDMPEAITGDITSPIQQIIGEDGRRRLNALQNKIFNALLLRHHVPPMTEAYEKKLKHLDMLALFIEKRDFLNSSNIWQGEQDYKKEVRKLPFLKQRKSSAIVESEFNKELFQALNDMEEQYVY